MRHIREFFWSLGNRHEARLTWLDAMLGDARHALRTLRRQPAFSIGVLLTLAMAIGVTVATFGIVNAVLLAPLPVRDQGRLMVLRVRDASRPDAGNPWSLTNAFLGTLRARAPAFAAFARVHAAGATPFAARYGDRLTTLASTAVGGELFQVLGVHPALGRLLRPADDSVGANPAVVLSYHAWQQDFGGDTAVIGRMLAVEGLRATIVGVAPPGFEFPAGTDTWISIDQMERPYGDDRTPEGGYFNLVGRLRQGATVGEGRSQFASLARDFSSVAMGDPKARLAVAAPYTQVVIGNTRPVLLILAAAVLLVLGVACINVAGLLLARGVERAPELAVWAAIGASRGRIAAQLLTESAVLGVTGGVLGTALGAGLLRAGVRLAPADWPRLGQVRFDGSVAAFAVALSVLSVLMFGLTPALAAAGPHLERVLRVSGGRTTDDRRSGRLRRSIVMAQVALAVVILVGAGLLGRSLVRLQQVDLGFEPRKLLISGLQLIVPITTDSAEGAREEARFRTLVHESIQRLAATPGIAGATTMTTEPFTGSGFSAHYLAEGQPADAAAHNLIVDYEVATDGYFGTLGMRVVRGRTFGQEDGAGTAPVAVVSEGFARATWPGQDPIGRRLSLGLSNEHRIWRTVIGVVADTRFRGLTTAPRPALYLSARQDEWLGVWLTVRTTGDPRQMLPAVTRVVQNADPDAGIRKVETGGELLSAQTARSRALAATLGLLATAVLLLAALGVFAVMATSVRGRTHEIGVRLALGATNHDIRALVLVQAMRMSIAGLAVGLALTLVATRVLRTQLFEVSPTDPLTVLAVVILLGAAVLIAAYLPARRAARVDPLMALRAE